MPLLHGFKNEIVLNSAGRANTYSFVTDFDGLTPRDSTGYSIPLEDENGEVVTYLALEELMDAAGNYSMENVIDIAQYENGQYLVTITLDEAFLADEDTVYPVTASASSTGWLYHTSMDDTHIMQSVPTTNYYGATVMYMGRWASYPARIMMQFVFTDALKNAIAPSSITEAKLYLWDQSTDTTRRDVNVRVPKNIWTASTITWNNNPGYYDSSWNGVARPAPHTISGDPGWWAYPYMRDLVSAMLRNYQDTSLPRTLHEKRGIMIKLENESVGLKTLRSSNHSENRPNMSITYMTSSPSSQYGIAWPYRDRPAKNPNCVGYALCMDSAVIPLFDTGNVTLSETAAAALMTDYLIDNGYVSSMRKLSSATSSISSNEYRACFRIQRKAVYIDDIGTYGFDQYHFLVQTNTGAWAHKMGDSASQLLGNINPSTNADWWDYVVSMSTPTLYYAITF